uniref:Uncharacterized protein n=1 Tax=Fagus sylvatica TaxID=28930 RepID=A0A2N9J8W9_FAGSY
MMLISPLNSDAIFSCACCGILYYGDQIFEDFFSRRLGGEDVKVSLELSFMEAVQGSTKTLTFQTHVACEPCGGRGVAPGVKPEKCSRCKGLGTISMQQGLFMVQITCPQCHGERETVPHKYICKSCRGKRVVLGTKSVKLNIMPGVDNDETIKVSRSGGADPDGNQPGDLYVVIKVREDPVFRREGADIHVDAVLSITQPTPAEAPISILNYTFNLDQESPKPKLDPRRIPQFTPALDPLRKPSISRSRVATQEHREQNQTRGGISMKMQGSRSHGGGNSGSAQSANSWSCRENFPATGELFCYCGIPAPVKTSRTPKNNGRRFCSCENFKVNRSCRFFVWVDPPLEGATLEEESKENSEIQAGCHEGIDEDSSC